MPVDPSISSLEQRPDCPGPELIAAYIDGRRLWWGGRRRLVKHFADCDRCFTLLRDITDFRDSDDGHEVPDAEPDQSSRFVALPIGGRSRTRAPRLAWLGAGGLMTMAAALLVVFVLRGPAEPRLDGLIAALGTQRVTDARIGGFQHGPRPEVMRAAEPGASVPSISLDARGAATRIQEEAEAEKATSPAARHAVGVSRLITGDLDAAVEDLESAVTAEPTNPTWHSDLAAALLTRRNPQDFEKALKHTDDALAKEPQHTEALFNRALALQAVGQREAAREAWERYLQVDATSAWAAEARQHLASSR